MHRCRGDDSGAALQAERRGVNQATSATEFCHFDARCESGLDIECAERINLARNGESAEIGVRGDFSRGDASDGGMAWEIHGVGDDCCGCVSRGNRWRKHGDGVRNAERKAASTPAAGGNASDGIVSRDFERAEKRRTVRAFDHADGVEESVGQVEGDIATIVDVSAIQRRSLEHRLQDGLGDGAGNCGHRSDKEVVAVRKDGVKHALRDGATGTRRIVTDTATKEREFRAQLIENRDKAACRGFIRKSDILPRAIRIDDQVYRSVLEMQPTAIG